MRRPLGASERLLWHLSRVRPVNAVLCASLTGPMSVERLRGALDFAQRRHALLAVRIRTDEEGRPWFDPDGVPPIPLRVLARDGEEHWSREAEDELSRPFEPGQGPLLRVTLLRGAGTCELLLTFDHSIGDGMSGAWLVRDLLRELSQPGAGHLLPAPATCEERLPAGVRRLADPPDRPRATGPARTGLPPGPGRAGAPGPGQGGAQRLLTWNLSEEDSSRLVTASHREGTSVHGALCAAFLLAMAAEPSPRAETVLTLMSPVNVRGHLVPPGGEDFAALFTRQLTRHRIQPDSHFWEVAREVKHQLSRDTAGPGLFTNLLAVEDFLSANPEPDAFGPFVKGLMGSELTLTNLGRLELEPPHGPFRLRRLYVTVSGLAPFIVGVTTVGGRVCICVRFLESLVPEARARRILAGARERLQSQTSHFASL